MSRTSKLSNVFSFLFMSKARSSKRIQRLVDEVAPTNHLDCTANKTLRRFLSCDRPQNSNQENVTPQGPGASLTVLAKVYGFPG